MQSVQHTTNSYSHRCIAIETLHANTTTTTYIIMREMAQEFDLSYNAFGIRKILKDVENLFDCNLVASLLTRRRADATRWHDQKTRSEDTTTNQTKPNQTKPNQTKPNQTKPNQTKPNQTKPPPKRTTSKQRLYKPIPNYTIRTNTNAANRNITRWQHKRSTEDLVDGKVLKARWERATHLCIGLSHRYTRGRSNGLLITDHGQLRVDDAAGNSANGT
jgi:hypothetical protein